MMESILFDYSKNLINQQILDELFNLAKELKLEEWKGKMFKGEHVNCTEDRAVLHTALRSKTALMVDGQDVATDVHAELQKMKTISDKVRKGQWVGSTGRPIKHVINIGIGGSDLGPAMVTNALWPYHQEGLSFHFVSNVDSADMSRVLKQIDIEASLFVVVSKTFTTAETMANANRARNVVLDMLKQKEAESMHSLTSISLLSVPISRQSVNLELTRTMWCSSGIGWVGGTPSGLPLG